MAAKPTHLVLLDLKLDMNVRYGATVFRQLTIQMGLQSV